jgi:anaerobic selenocysteine-containing dehydrogenase
MHEELIKSFGIHTGDKVNLTHLENEARVEVQAEEAGNPREVVVNRSDLEKLGAEEGARVNVRFPK